MPDVEPRGAPGLYNNASSTQAIIPAPANVAVDEVLVCDLTTQGGSFQSAPTGWTTLWATNTGSVTNPKKYAFWKVATSDDVTTSTNSGTYTWTVGTSAIGVQGGIQRYGNVDTSDPIALAAVLAEATTGSQTMSVNVTGSVPAGACLIGGSGINSSNTSNTLAPPTNWTERWDQAAKRGTYADRAGWTGGAPGTVTFTGGGSNTLAWRAWVAALRPAAGSAPALSGTAAFTGSGTLTGAGAPAAAGTASLSGSGTLAATGTAATVGTASFGGSGALTAGGAPTATGTAALSGSGTLTASGQQVTAGSAALTGSGTLATAPSTLTVSGTAVLSGSGTLAATPTALAVAGTATLTGSGTLTASGAAALVGTGVLSGSGVLTASGSAEVSGSGTAELSGSGTLDTSGSASFPISVSWVGMGSWANSIATTGTGVGYPAGADTDCIIGIVGAKPFGTIITVANQTSLGSSTSGTVANGNGTGSTRSQLFARSGTVPTAAGSDAVTTTLSPSPLSSVAARFARSGGDSWSLDYVGLADTDETGTAVSATGTATADEFRTGDMVLIHVALKDDVITHTSMSLVIDGCTISAITWMTRQLTTSGNDMSNYVGYATVTAGSSTGAVTYTATSNTSGAAAAAVSLARVRAVQSGPPALSGTATFTGSGALTGTGMPAVARAATLSGSGTLTTIGGPVYTGAATFGGSGALVISGAPGITRSATLTGSGLLTASGSGVMAGGGTATLSGSGTLTVTGAMHRAGTVALTGSGALNVTGLLATVGGAVLTGSGTLNLAGAATVAAGVTLSGAGELTVVGVAALGAQVAFTGGGSLTLAGFKGVPAIAMLDGVEIIGAIWNGVPVLLL